MKTADSQALYAPPSLTKALLAGFDSITNHIGLIFFPVVLDVLLWLGPHLRLVGLIERLTDQLFGVPGIEAPETTEVVRLSREFWLYVAERLNLFSSLRSYPVGIPSLMVSIQPVSAPSGLPIAWEVPSIAAVIFIWIILTLAGLALGALFFDLVAQAALSGKVAFRQALQQWPWSAVQVLVLALFWLIILLIVSLPGSCLITIASLGGIGLGRLGIFLYLVVIIWFLFPLLLSPHGIFVNRYRMWLSVREGMRLTRLTLPTTALLFLTIVVLTEGLDLLWKVPGETSWFTLIGVAGHAFVTTGLLAASFVYYRDASSWVQRKLNQIRLSTTA